MADPAFATARHVDELTEVPLEGLPSTTVDEIKSERLRRCASCGAPVRGDLIVDDDGGAYHEGCYQP